MSPDSVGLEIATVTFHLRDADAADEIYRNLDEQALSGADRRILATNGFRAGVFGTQMPSQIHDLLQIAADRRAHPTAESVREGLDQQRFLQCLAGTRHKVQLMNHVGQLAMSHFDGDTRLVDVVQDGVCLLSLQAKPAGDLAATIRLSPEIEHGPLRQRYAVADGSFHLEATRESIRYDDLEISIPLSAGETMMVTCTGVEGTMGRQFFVDTDLQRQKILLIRLAQTQPRPLFGERLDSPLTTIED